jgi:hypothetical protein
MKPILTKTSNISLFACFHQQSGLASKVFNPIPKLYDTPIRVLQIMLIEDGYLMVEYEEVKQ